MSEKADKKSKVFPSLESMIFASFITITLKPEYYQRRARVQWSLLAKATDKLLMRYTDKYMIVPELTKAGNIHFHGFVKWTSRIDYPMDRLIDDIKVNKVLGTIFVTPNRISNVVRAQAAMDYCFGEYQKTQAVLRVPDIINEWSYEYAKVALENKTIKYIDGDIDNKTSTVEITDDLLFDILDKYKVSLNMTNNNKLDMERSGSVADINKVI